ncbi:6005_t:CDS:2 [Cetraspora pellucida]|uniref:6005_t:CDS:1 n=1 Tax=Cetraspora pellucida TaxID=1433469 RepID=A0A9N9JR81_9GLOM|nr:6005_t:CDS:2 [Cetraspora pellucida]
MPEVIKLSTTVNKKFDDILRRHAYIMRLNQNEVLELYQQAYLEKVEHEKLDKRLNKELREKGQVKYDSEKLKSLLEKGEINYSVIYDDILIDNEEEV